MSSAKAKLKKDFFLYNFVDTFKIFSECRLSGKMHLRPITERRRFYGKFDQDSLKKIKSLYYYIKVEIITWLSYFSPCELVCKKLDVKLYYIIQAFHYDHNTISFHKSDWELS